MGRGRQARIEAYERDILLLLGARKEKPIPSGLHLLSMLFLLDQAMAFGTTPVHRDGVRFWRFKVGPRNRFAELALQSLVRKGLVRFSRR